MSAWSAVKAETAEAWLGLGVWGFGGGPLVNRQLCHVNPGPNLH